MSDAMPTAASPATAPPQPSRGRRVALRVAALFLALCLTAGAGEVLARFALPEWMTASRDASTDWQPHARAGWVQKPNLDITTRERGGRALRFRTNADGLTPPTAVRAKPAGVTRLLIFGDSAAVGRSVLPEETVHAHLEQLLQGAEMRAEVFNAGVEGYATDQELVRMEELLPLYAPDVVLLVVCENDFGGNALRSCYGLNKVSFTREADGSLREHPPTPNQEILYEQHSGWARWLRHSALYRALWPYLAVLRARLGGWEQRSIAGLDSGYYSRPDELERFDWKLFTTLVARMQACCAARGARLLLYVHPDVAAVWEPYAELTIRRQGVAPDHYDRHVIERRVHAVAREVRADFCPLVDSFLRQQERGPFHLLPNDPHCNGMGYLVTAETLATHLLDHDYFPGRERRSAGGAP
jgi:hypothetical protein